jgi:hypothetical protein
MVPPGRDQGLGYLDVIDQGAFDEYQCLYSEDAASQVMLSTAKLPVTKVTRQEFTN